MKDKIKKFIEDNKLDFSGSGSDLNGQCVILAGYALYLNLDLKDMLEITDDLEILPAGSRVRLVGGSCWSWEEFKRVFEYAEANNYGDWWKHKEAHDMYIFE